ncbi:13705_t:CDS:2, partial [Racocetra fulgida]
NDLFIGFDENETLQRLATDFITRFPKDNEEAIVKRCKATLIDIASSDGITRATRSNVDPGDINLWYNVYFCNFTDEHIPQQNHDSLNTITRFIINTFSNINTDITECLKDLFKCQVDKLSMFKTETQLQNRVKQFWEESDKNMLIFQCDATTMNIKYVKLAKFIVEQFQIEFLKQNPYIAKYVCIILHIQRDQNYKPLFNFIRPIAKMLFALEKLSVTKTFISISQKKRNLTLITFLQTMFLNPKVLNTNGMLEPEPDQYVMPELFYDLKFPFSYYFMKKINEFRSTWEDELAKLRENPENCDDDQGLSSEVFENAVIGFRANLLARLLRQHIGKDKVLDPVLLHIYWWESSNIISADLQLAQMCPSAINEFAQKMPDISFEEFLVDEAIKMMLDKIVKNGGEPQLDQWQHE